MVNSTIKNVDLSIIIPCYNAELYISKTLDSIVDFDFRGFNIEIIIINDGSFDDSEKIILSYSSKYDFIKLINQNNQGVSSAINSGLNVFTGDYVFVLASDDWCYFNTILNSLEIAKSKKLDIIAFGLETYNEKNIVTGTRKPQPVPHNVILSGRQILEFGYYPSSICVFLLHSSFFKEKKIRFIENLTHNDVEISNRLMLEANSVYYTNEIGYCYFRHDNTITIPRTIDKLKRHLADSIIVASHIKNNIVVFELNENKIKQAIQKNYNSVVWSLLLRFIQKPNEVDYEFKKECLEELKKRELYPIKGSLKTNFQKITSIFFNFFWLYKLVIKFKK